MRRNEDPHKIWGKRIKIQRTPLQGWSARWNHGTVLCQYGLMLYVSWTYPTARMSLMAVMTSLTIAIILYLGLSFASFLNTSECLSLLGMSLRFLKLLPV